VYEPANFCVGGGAWLSGYPTAVDRILAVTTITALVPVLFSIIRDLGRRKDGVDVIALLAMAGAVLLHEDFVGAVIAAMYSSGRAAEGYASAHAARELPALLQRTPHAVHRYEGAEPTSPSLGDVAIGDRLLINTGDIVPVDGLVEGHPPVLDLSALAGEPGPVDLPELRTLLYPFYATLRLHFAKEDADYLSLIDARDTQQLPA